jgi:hypothetical protein
MKTPKKKLLIPVLPVYAALILITAGITSAQTIEFSVTTGSASYLRYDIVSFTADLRQDGSPVTDSSATLTGRVLYGGQPVTTVGNIQTFSLYFNSTDDMWHGYWALPWNPELGQYTLEVTADIGGDIHTETTTFDVALREPRIVLPPGYLAMNAENVEDLTGFNVPGPFGEAGDWLNMFDWAEFMAAIAAWLTSPSHGALYRTRAPNSTASRRRRTASLARPGYGRTAQGRLTVWNPDTGLPSIGRCTTTVATAR